MIKFKILILVLTVAVFSSCTKENDAEVNCGSQVVISADKYITAPNDQLTINNLELNGDCLTINFSSGGCSGDTWELELIDAAIILESNPPQRNLRLSLKNEELCLAYITEEISFDLKDLQIDGNEILLNMTNSGDQILYEY